ncbi:FAD-dependent monooxygenase [Actinocrinis puniceicyclus]|uniref:FAD-dependent monooxygenase n=1 Tax=Actinocrinis puniceicyclus TaxID=977794 RepID=A0A8J7WMV3_9ACTN|nr:NAD(P)/FAD-dependent oxidoreductase [Actinocrinis puniceicyclus]MBS2962355.1 FAD-dependent monooxygenase [Actinocrinis puniceicyclus]
MAGATAVTGAGRGYDVVVVGARVAGSATAMLLARMGHRVLLVDRMGFPSDTMSSHFIPFYGAARLERWGLLDRLLATGCPPVARLTSDWGQVRLTGRPPAYQGTRVGVCPRRYVLDKLLIDAAVESGVEFEERFLVTELLGDGDRVTGVRGRTSSGARVTVPASFVVGADGMRSLVARTVGAEEYNTVPPLTVTYYTYFENLNLDDLLIHWRPGRCVPAIPTHDGLAVVLCGSPHAEWRELRKDVEGGYFAAIERDVPEFAERLRDARRVERFSGTHHVPNFFRKPFGPGWALVGDAGYHKDPVTALGMSDAFRDAEYLAAALHEALEGARPADEALAEYEVRRNRDAEPLYKYTLEQARYQPLDRLTARVLKALEDNEEDRDQFFGILAGSVLPEEFSALDNIVRILTRAGLMPT